MRWRLVRRGALLYVGGLLLDEIWPGTIIPFYGGMFVIAACLFTLRSRWIVADRRRRGARRAGRSGPGASGAPRTARARAWLTAPRTGTPRGYVFDLFVNGTHPLLPWLAFLCAGIVLGRLSTGLVAAGGDRAGFTLYSFATIVARRRRPAFQLTLLSTDPFERGLVYVASALGTALIAYAHSTGSPTGSPARSTRSGGPGR